MIGNIPAIFPDGCGIGGYGIRPLIPSSTIESITRSATHTWASGRHTRVRGDSKKKVRIIVMRSSSCRLSKWGSAASLALVAALCGARKRGRDRGREVEAEREREREVGSVRVSGEW
jgi:hypothetical protein